MGEFAAALGKGFGKTSLQSYYYAGTIFRLFLEDGKKFSQMPVNLEVTSLLFTIYKKGSKDLALRAWKNASARLSPERVTKSVFENMVSTDALLQTLLAKKNPQKKHKWSPQPMKVYQMMWMLAN